MTFRFAADCGSLDAFCTGSGFEQDSRAPRETTQTTGLSHTIIFRALKFELELISRIETTNTPALPLVLFGSAYLLITPQAMRSPELPDGSVFISSALA
jgi:hypothetical protein